MYIDLLFSAFHSQVFEVAFIKHTNEFGGIIRFKKKRERLKIINSLRITSFRLK